MSKKENMVHKLSFIRQRAASNPIINKKLKKTRKVKYDSLRLHKSSLYYVAEEPNSRVGILEKFLDFLLVDKILTREPLLKKVEWDKISNVATNKDQIGRISKEFKDLEDKDLEQAKVVSAVGSKLLLDRSTGPKLEEPSGRSEERKTVRRISSQGIDPLQKLIEQTKVPTSVEVLKSSTEGFTVENRPLLVKMEKITFRNGNVYEGSTNEYVMNGKGKFVWADNTVYTGEFVDGHITGKGEIILPDLSKYEGDFCCGFFHGNGFLNIVSTPRYYYGTWKHGKKDGNGWLMYEPGDWYEGEWQLDLRHGHGFRRYKNGAKYSGDWVDNRKQGKGKMLFHNDDYYCGEWYDDKPHGYGEYTWELIRNKTFCFPIYNWYKGAWKNGERDGIGIMNFGTESGAKYAGTWRNNFKHGPGVAICGNGLVLESNPIFEFNKPVHKNFQISFTELCEDNIENNLSEGVRDKCSYHEIVQLISSQTACSRFDKNLLANITKNSRNIPSYMFIKLNDNTTSGSKKMWCPLDIPTHTIAEDVDLKYFIDLIFDYILKYISTEMCAKLFEINLRSSESGFQKQTYLSSKCSTTPTSDPTESFFDLVHPEEKIRIAKQKEMLKIKNAIIIYLIKLKTLYDKYASFAKSKSGVGDVKLDFKPVLVRFFLWQLLRDLRVVDEGVQLVDIDMLIWNNPASCLDTKLYPFEPIYFYQFVMYLMGAAWLTYLANSNESKKRSLAELLIPSKIFRNFLDRKLENIEMMRGSALADHMNLIPLHSLYEIYVNIGEPITTEAFLGATFREEGEEPPCYYAMYNRPYSDTNLRDGFNAVPVAHDVYFIREPVALNEREIRRCEDTNEDKFKKTLYTFRTLGKEAILNAMAKVCPKITSSSKEANMKYKLTFLEFYEILVLLAFLKAEQEIKIDEMRLCKATYASDSYKSKSKKKKLNELVPRGRFFKK